MLDKKVNLNAYVVPELKEYLVKQSEAYGMSISSFLALIITTYRQQTDALKQLSDMQDLLKEIKNIS